MHIYDNKLKGPCGNVLYKFKYSTFKKTITPCFCEENHAIHKRKLQVKTSISTTPKIQKNMS